MFKKINLILIMIGLTLLTKLDLYFCFFTPIVFFYLLKDSKNLYIIVPVSIVTCLIANQNYIYLLLISFLLIEVFIYILKASYNLNSKLFISSGITLINIISILLKNENINKYLLFVIFLFSVFIYLFLEQFLVKAIKDKTNLFTDKMSYIEILILFLTSLGFSSLESNNINIGFIVTCYFVFYLSRKYKNIYSLMYAFFTMILYTVAKEINIGYFLLVFSAIYALNNTFSIMFTNIFLCFFLFNEEYSYIYTLSIMGESILFELIQHFIIYEKKEDLSLSQFIASEVQNANNKELLAFSEFIDRSQQLFVASNELNLRIGEGIKSIVNNHCNSCVLKKECFAKFKNDLYKILSKIITQASVKEEYDEFCKFCPKQNNMAYIAKMFEEKLNKKSILDSSQKQNIIIGQLTRVSSAIKKYVVESEEKNEISYLKIIAIKEKISEYGFNISYFEVEKIKEDDFLFFIGLNENDQDASEPLELIVDSILDIESSVIFDSKERGKIYFKIIPKIKTEITYGYGALSSEGESICGDNYLINELGDGRFLCCISDGMGSGYNAYYESNNTLNLIKNISSKHLSSAFTIEVINSFYAMQDYLEQYATLDYLEINRFKKIATFYKLGATTSYIIKKEKRLEKVINKNLPFGIEDSVEKFEYLLEDGDIIILTSDGVFENIVNADKLESFLLEIATLPPQKLVYELLNFTIKQKLLAKDDMSIIALKIRLV